MESTKRSRLTIPNTETLGLTPEKLNICRPLRGLDILLPLNLGLTPQAMYMPPLRGSSRVVSRNVLKAVKRAPEARQMISLGREPRKGETSQRMSP